MKHFFFKMTKLAVSLILMWTVSCISVTIAVTNGHKAVKGQFPYQVYISDGRTFCGASIIHKRWLLTAGHCKSDYDDTDMFARIGSIYTDGDGQVIGVEKFIRHKKYEYHDDGVTETILYDIGLIRLNRDIKFSNTIKPIKLAKDDTIRYENVTATISGWGLHRKPGRYPYTLHYLEVPVISDEECAKASANKHIFNNGICTSVVNDKSTCDGDSGSPLTYEGKLIGIACTGDQDCKFSVPSIYTRVSTYVPWIKRQLKAYSDTLL